MKILMIGGGGREHALIWKLKQSAMVDHIWCAPGNGGISRDAECISTSIADPTRLADLACELAPDLTVVGPEQPLVAGIVDRFTARGLKIVGPSHSAAKLEGSKIYAKQFLERYCIPTARIQGIYDSSSAAYSALKVARFPLVIKADGPCAGKGVLVTSSADEAASFIYRLLEEKEFGDAGSQILIEDALQGRELSFIVLTDGHHVVPMAPAQDHKRAFDGDRGPNTGGMGAFSVDELIDANLEGEILQKVVQPTLSATAKEGASYCGFLYCGLMLTQTGPQVLEFNCRMGDPECQAIVARMQFDLAEALDAATSGELDRVDFRWQMGASVCVVLASGGYPGKYETGKVIEGLPEAERQEGVTVFHAGTRASGNECITAGGRVLGVTATGENLAEAAARAYHAARAIRFEGMYYRKDISLAK